MHRSMKSGTPLAAVEGVETVRVKEFRFRPDADCFPKFFVDGEAFDGAEVHVQILPRRIAVFAT